VVLSKKCLGWDKIILNIKKAIFAFFVFFSVVEESANSLIKTKNSLGHKLREFFLHKNIILN
jgi:hypothetical protein